MNIYKTPSNGGVFFYVRWFFGKWSRLFRVCSFTQILYISRIKSVNSIHFAVRTPQAFRDLMFKIRASW